jgi:hypothetical protein
MKWLAVGVAIGACLPAAQFAQAAAPQSAVNRRQLADCMTREMAASRTISYYEAAKVCKERLKSQVEGLSASNQAKPANAR